MTHNTCIVAQRSYIWGDYMVRKVMYVLFLYKLLSVIIMVIL